LCSFKRGKGNGNHKKKARNSGRERVDIHSSESKLKREEFGIGNETRDRKSKQEVLKVRSPRKT